MTEPAWQGLPCVPNSDKVCYAFVYTPNNNSAVEALLAEVKNVADHVTAGEGQSGGYKGFGTQKEMDDWVLDNTNMTDATITFSSVS